MLANSIALIAVASLFGIEGYKVKDTVPRRVLAAFALLFTVGALFLGPIVNQAPLIGTFLTSIFGNPLAWFVLMMGLFFVLRPTWHGAQLLKQELVEAPHEGDSTIALQGNLSKRLAALQDQMAKLFTDFDDLRQATDSMRVKEDADIKREIVEKLAASEFKFNEQLAVLARVYGISSLKNNGLALLNSIRREDVCEPLWNEIIDKVDEFGRAVYAVSVEAVFLTTKGFGSHILGRAQVGNLIQNRNVKKWSSNLTLVIQATQSKNLSVSKPNCLQSSTVKQYLFRGRKTDHRGTSRDLLLGSAPEQR